MEYHLYHVLNIIFLSFIVTRAAQELGETSCVNSPISKVVRQNNNLIINCQNQSVIQFVKANFGRNKILRSPQYLGTETLNCNREKETLDVLNNYCSNQSSCELRVTKERFESPLECWKNTKNLELMYFCLQEKCRGNQTSTQSTSHEYNRTYGAISTTEIFSTYYETDGTNSTTAVPGKWKITTDFQSTIFDSKKPFTDDSLVGIVCGGVSSFLIIIVLVVIICWKCRRKIKHSNVEKTDRNPTDIRGHQYDNSPAHIQTSVTDLIGDKVKNQAIEMHPIDMSRNAVVNDLDNDVTENIYDISGAGERNSLLMTGEAEDDTYDLTNQGEKVGEEHYDVHVTDDTYDVSRRCNRRNNAENYVDDTYDHFIQGNDYDLN